MTNNHKHINFLPHLFEKHKKTTLVLIVLFFFVIMTNGTILIGYALGPADLLLLHWPHVVDFGSYRGGSYVPSDEMDWYLPTYMHSVTALKNGNLPLFSWDIGNGMPFLLALYHSGNAILAVIVGWLTNPVFGWNFAQIIKIIIFTLGNYIILSRFTNDKYLPAITTFCLIFSTTFITGFGRNFTDIAAWNVLLLATLICIIEKYKWWHGPSIAICIFFIVTSAYPPIVISIIYLNVISVISYAIWQNSIKKLMHPIVIIFAAIGLLLTLPFLFDSFEFFLGNASHDIAYRNNLSKNAFDERFFAFLINPLWLGNGPSLTGASWYYQVNYFGFLLTFGFLYHIIFVWKSHLHLFIKIFNIFVILISTNITGLHSFLSEYVPLLDKVRPLSHLYFLITVFGLHAMLGLDIIIKRQEWKKIAFTAVVYMVLMVGIKETMVFDELEWMDIVSNSYGLIFLPAFFLFIISYFRNAMFKGHAWKTIVASALILIPIDLYLANKKIIRTTPADQFFPNSSTLQDTAKLPGKILPFDRTFLAATHLAYDIRSLGWRGFFTNEWRETLHIAMPELPTPKEQPRLTQYLFRKPALMEENSWKLLDFMGVSTYSLVANSENARTFEKLVETRCIKDKKNCFTSWEASKIKFFHNPKKAKSIHQPSICVELKHAKQLEFLRTRDLFKYFTSQNCSQFNANDKDDRRRTIMTVRTSQEYTINLGAGSPTTLVFGDNYHPGLVATINDVEVPIFRVNYNFFAISIDSEEVQNLKIKYRPKFLRLVLN